MTDRLRRLDALFAERVLGHTIQPDHRGMTAYDGGPPVVVGESATGDYGCSYGSIPHYTRSLDAAWEGAQMRFDWWVLRKITSRGHPENDLFFIAEVGKRQEKGEYSADHPAEALVLACLRAVGCSEEELK